ncbi:MAG: metallophosphoesterase [Oscillospiraceae bacterium]|nr:metallophosphoesterase [Oscillospiraceae bacterium]
MIYITGDTHGDLQRFKTHAAKKLKKDDYLIICGDFGFLWSDSAEERKNLEFLQSRKYTILFLDGCHENFDALERYPTVDFCTGKARKIAKNIYQLMRGEIFEIEDYSIFAFGGGVSPDLDLVVDSGNWSEKEMPTQDEYKNGAENLQLAGSVVDYIVTHEPPALIKKRFEPKAGANDINLYFEELRKAVRYNQWFFGSLHLDKKLNDKTIAVFKDILPIGQVVKARRF